MATMTRKMSGGVRWRPGVSACSGRDLHPREAGEKVKRRTKRGSADLCFGFPRGLLAGSAHRHAIDAQRRLTHPDRHPLAVLAAGADTGIERQIVADHAHAGERVGPVADHHGAFERRADLAVLDAVDLGALEHELAGGDVYLPAAEIDR